MVITNFHADLTAILFALGTAFYWFGYFAKSKTTQGKLFTTGRWLLTITSIIAIIAILFLLYAIFAVMTGHYPSHETMGHHTWRGISLILVFIMTFWGWMLHRAKKALNYFFLIGLLITLAFLLF